MNKDNLIKKLSEKMKIQPREAKVIVDNLFGAMKESLEKGERIEIRGFGSFVMRQYGGYKGRNPKQVRLWMFLRRSFHISRLARN